MDAAVRARELGRAALLAQLHAMQAQVEPHFLYNTLANLKYLIRTDADRAQAMVDHLVGYFQAALPDMRSESSTVARELDLAEHYLSLMQVRMGARLRFRMDVDPAALGLPVAAFVRIRPAAGRLDKIAELAASLPQISECHRITGEDCFLAKVHAPTIGDLEAVLDKFLVYGQTVSSIVVSTPVPPRPLPPV
jgi:Lrp/AsnC family leucine-responsive transcriptional regulator